MLLARRAKNHSYLTEILQASDAIILFQTFHFQERQV